MGKMYPRLYHVSRYIVAFTRTLRGSSSNLRIHPLLANITSGLKAMPRRQSVSVQRTQPPWRQYESEQQAQAFSRNGIVRSHPCWEMWEKEGCGRRKEKEEPRETKKEEESRKLSAAHGGQNCSVQRCRSSKHVPPCFVCAAFRGNAHTSSHSSFQDIPQYRTNVAARDNSKKAGRPVTTWRSHTLGAKHRPPDQVLYPVVPFDVV